MKRERLDQKEFYIRLAEALDGSFGDIWTETVLSGSHAGEKYLVRGGAEMAPSVEAAADHADSPGESAADSADFSVETEKDLSGENVKDAVPAGDDSSAPVFRERIGKTPRLIICGGGHVSMPVIRMGKMLGFTVTVLEDRPKFSDNARAAGADTVICEPFEDALAGIRGDSDSWFVIVTRGHRYDTICLESILKKTCAYVGMMGSRRRVAIVKDQLAAKGISRELLDGVHTPIGLKIGAETPEEIAVSIMAEIIQVKHSGSKCGGYPEALLSAILADDGRQKVLATIISRKGSAPRGTGTKMLIFEDGATVDTIGGGCVESEIIQKALLMMRTGEKDFQICEADLTMEAAEDEGMVCGGVVEVMLEKLA